jgi:predicted transcriptional regulator YheO
MTLNSGLHSHQEGLTALLKSITKKNLALLKVYKTPQDNISEIVNNYSGRELDMRLTALEERECQRWMKGA